MQDLIKRERKKIDAIHNAVSELPGGREMPVVKTSLQRGGMFLGLVLGAMGEENPYPQSTNHENEIIDARQDKADFVIKYPIPESSQDSPSPTDIGYVNKIKYLRGLLQDTVIDSLSLMLQESVEMDKGISQLFSSYLALKGGLDDFKTAESSIKEAKMWLGQQLNVIRENDEDYQKQLDDWEKEIKIHAFHAYNRYGSVTDFKNFRGEPMPLFKDLPDQIQKAWVNVVAIHYWKPSNKNQEYSNQNGTNQAESLSKSR